MSTLPSLISKEYSWRGFRSDLAAALTVVVLVIPQGMAYSVLAGMPPVYGLYASVLALLIYPFLGTSIHLSVGPVALISILLVSGIGRHAEPMSSEFIGMAILVSLIAGVFQLLMSIFRLGFLSNFLSYPVLSGFTSAAGVIIIISQCKYLLGIQVPRSANAFLMVRDLLQSLPQTNVLTLALGGLAIVLLSVLLQFRKNWPSALVITMLGALVVFLFDLDEQIDVIGSIPSGLPGFELPSFASWKVFQALVPLGLVIGLISFLESLVIAKSLEDKTRMSLDPDKELLALGFVKVIGAFFQSFACTGSFSRSALNKSAGATTGLASILAGVLVAASLLSLTHLFYYIPYPVLAAIVIVAVAHLIDLRQAIELFKADRGDFWVLLTTFLATLLLGVQVGVAVGIILSLVIILKKISYPHYAVLGKIDEAGIYRNISRFADAQVSEQILIFRYDDNLFFGNAEHFAQAILKALNTRPNCKYLILDMSSISHIDSTAIQRLRTLFHAIKKRSIEIHLTGAKGPLRDRFSQEGINEHLHLSIEKCVQVLSSKS